MVELQDERGKFSEGDLVMLLKRGTKRTYIGKARVLRILYGGTLVVSDSFLGERHVEPDLAVKVD